MSTSAVPDHPMNGGSTEAGHPGTWAGLSRGELFAGLCVLGFANGTVGRVQAAVLQEGLMLAIGSTFKTSAVVWVAFAACPAMFLRGPQRPVRRADIVVAACVLLAILLPIAPVSWVALTGLAFYILADSYASEGPQSQSPVHRGAWILLAITGSMFWGRVLLFSASGPVLSADARLVGWLAGTETMGNTVRFADGDGYVWIAPYCSSISNISLAVLCWVLFAQFRGQRWSLRSVAWCLLACVAVVAINVTRISLMVMHEQEFDLIHGPVGSAVSSWLSIAAVLMICMWGTHRERLTPSN